MPDFKSSDKPDDGVKPSDKRSLADRVAALEVMVESMADHMENSQRFTVARAVASDEKA